MSELWTSVNRPPNPFKGQTIIEADTGNLMIYYGATLGWKPPWNLPWGELAYSIVPSTGSYCYVGAPLTNASSRTNPTNVGFTVNLIKNRKYLLEIDAYTYNNASSGPNSVQALQIGDRSKEASSTVMAANLMENQKYWARSGGTVNLATFPVVVEAFYKVDTDVSKTFDFRGPRDGFAGNYVLQDQTHFTIADTGPVGNPPPDWIPAGWDNSKWDSTVTFWS